MVCSALISYCVIQNSSVVDGEVGYIQSTWMQIPGQAHCCGIMYWCSNIHNFDI